MSKLPRQRRMIVEALEPRLMFSATADIAVFHDSASDVDYLAHAADNIDLTHVYALPDEPLIVTTDTPDAADASNNTISATQDSSTHQADTTAVTTQTTIETPLPAVADITLKAAASDVPDSPGLTTTAEPTKPTIDVIDTGLVAMAKADVQAMASQTPTDVNAETVAANPPVFVFVDTTVENYQALVKDIQDNNSNQNITIVYLNPDENGVQQITDTLANQTGVAAIHLITHGNAGSFQLGNAAVNQNTLDNYADELTAWQRSLSTNADILIYGCDVGSTDAGQQLIAQIGELTQADVAASNDLTGSALRGGDWDLEIHYGSIETNVLISAQTQQDWDLLLANSNYIYVSTGNTSQTFTGTSNVGQDFLFDSPGATYAVNQIAVQLKTIAGVAAQTITLTLRNSWDGAVLRSDTISSSSLTTSFDWYSFNFSSYNLNDNQTYIIQIYSSGSDAKVAVNYNNSNQWNGSEFIVNGTHNSSQDLAFLLAYHDTNQTPFVNSAIPDQTATEHSAFNFSFSSTAFKDNDVGDHLTYTATLSSGAALPSWLSFNASTRTFSGTPGSNDSGTIAVKVTASDGSASITDTFNIAVANDNTAPTVANAIPDKNATEDSAFSFQFASNTFADSDADPLTYTATLSSGAALPSWLSFDAATRTFSGTPLNGDVGTIAVKVTADDSQGGTITDTFNITTANTNDAPTVANLIPDKAATEDSAFSFQFASNSFADVDVGDTLTYSATLSGGGALPAWLSFNAATRTFSGTPLNADVGTITVKVTASDGNGGTVFDTFDIVTANTNDAPTVANVIPDRTATEDSAFSYQFASNTFADVDVGDTLTYSATLSGGAALPSWLSFNAATRTFSGTPLNADVGTISVQVTANDSHGGTVSDTFDIVTSNTNDAPTVANAIPDRTATEDSAFTYQFASNTFNDVDVGDTLTYTSTLAGGGALPAWLSFNAATRTFSGTPLNADVGTISVKVTASDGNGGTIFDTFDIVVANTNDAPTVANVIPDQNATEDSAFSFQFASNTFADVDVGDTLTYSATLSGGAALPSWLSFNAATRTFSGTPLNADVGTISVQVTANDGHGTTVNDTFDIVTANTNDAPTVANLIPDKNATEDSAFSFQFASNTFADVDVGDTLTYTSTLAGGGALPAWLSFNAATRTFSGTPLNADVGTISVKVTASDGNGGTIFDTFDIVVANTNDAPTVANVIADQNATEDSAFSFQFPSNSFNDVDVSDTLTYTATLSGGAALPSWLSFNAATRTFSGTPLNADVGTISVEVTANDSHGGIISDTFDIVTANTNDAPTVANLIPDKNATEDSAFSFQFASNTFNDVDVGDTLTYTSTLAGGGALPAWLSFNAATRTFSGTPLNADVGTISVKVTASDGNGGTVFDTFDIVIANTNDAPTVANIIPDQNATQDSPFSFQFVSNSFADVDVGDTLTYTATVGGGALPAWLTFDANTRTFSGTPLSTNVGTISVQVTANDGHGGTINDTFDIVVANVNDAPTVANAIPDRSVVKLNPFSYQVAANAFTDIDGDTLTYTAQLSGGGALPAWLSFDVNTRTFSGTPQPGDVGTIAVEVTANDGLLSASDTFNITVTNTNFAPTVANTIPDQAVNEDAAFNFQFASNTFNDVDGDTLSYSAQLSGGAPLPSWLSFNAATCTFSGTPLNGDVGTISVEVIADDGSLTISDVFDIVISNTNDAPTVANALVDQNATEDAAFNFQFPANTFNDVDTGATLTYTATLSGGGALPAWLSFNAATRTFSGTPTNADVGTLSIKVIADDGLGGTGNDIFDIVIANTNDAPTVANVIPDQNATEDSAFTFQFASNTFGDVDVGNTLSYSATLSGGGALPAWLSFNAATRTFSGTPTNANVGTISIDVTADDGNGGTIADTFDIVIANTNDAPTVANIIPDQNATEDAAFNYQFPANSFNDVDVGDTLTYTSTLSGGGALPAWLSFNAATRTFSGTPTNSDVGTISVKVVADDGNGGTIFDTFDIVIANTNDAPTVANAIPDQNATEDSAFNFQFASNTFNDVDVGNTLSYSATLSGGAALPSWLSFNATTRTFSGTPLNADVGTISIEVTADDGNGGTIADTFDIVIANTNDAPTVANIILNQNATEDAAFSFQFPANSFNDVDVGDTLTYTSTLAGGGALPTWLSFNAATRTFSGTPTNSDVGAISVKVVADDGNGGTVFDTFDIVIANTNDAPTVANAIPDKNATEDSAFSFQFASNTFSDVDVGDTLSYTATLSGGAALPAWLSFNATTRTFSGTPLNADVGTISVEVTADDGNGGTIADTFDIVIANTNDAPTVANIIPDQNATEDAAFNYQFPANSFDDVDTGATLTYTSTLAGGGALPAWLSFNAATRTFSGTPTNADVGTLSIKVVADDGLGGTVFDTFDIVIANTNDAPTVANIIPDRNATEDSAFSFQFASNTFSDVDVGDTLSYSATLSGGAALPSWLTFNAATRTFSGTPLNADVGTISVEVTANDHHGGTVADTFDIVIANTNDAPTVANAIPDQAAVEDSAFSFQFASNAFNDIDVSDTLTYTSTLSNGAALPAWLSFNAATRTFSGTPVNADVGTIAVKVIADDGNGSTIFDTFDIVIANTNDTPTVANPIPDQIATEDSAFNFQFSSNAFSDLDTGDTLTYTATISGGVALPLWLSFDANTRTFSGTPTNVDVGTVTIKVTANDGNGGIINDTFDIIIANTNDAPTVANAIPDQSATEDSAFSFQFASNTFDDIDAGDTLTYTAQVGGGPLPSWLSFDANTRTFSGTPLNADVGTLSVQVIANDGQGGTVSDVFDIVIANTYDAPAVANVIPDQNATEDSAFVYQIPNNTFVAVDVGSTLTYTATLSGGGALPAWLSFDANTHTFSGTPDNNDVNTIAVKVTVDDGLGGTASDTFNLVVINSNDVPTVANAIPNQTATEDSVFNYTFAANTFADVDVSDTLTYTAQVGGGALPSWLSFDANTRTFSGTPLNADVGITTVQVIANDGHGGTVTSSFDIVIANTNDAPIVANAIPNQNATEDSAFVYQIPNNTFVDVDAGSTLTYTATLSGGGALPAWLSFNANTHTFSGTPDNNDVGTIAVQVTVNDGLGGTVSDTFNLAVLNSNDAPTVANVIPNQTTNEDSAFNFQFASNTFNDVDAADTLTYSATLSDGAALPSWLSFNAATRTFNGTPVNADVGTLSIQVIADDGHGGTINTAFDIVIINTPDAPTVANTIDNKIITINQPFNFVIPTNTFHDDDTGDALTYNVHLSDGSALPAWLTFNASTHTFSGTPLKDNANTLLKIEVSVTDNTGNTVNDTFEIFVDKEASVYTPETPTKIIAKPSTPEIPDTPLPGITVDDHQTTTVETPAAVVDDTSDKLVTNSNNVPLVSFNDYATQDESKNNVRLMDIRNSLSIANSSPLLASLISPDSGFSASEVVDFNTALRRVHDEMNQALDAEDMQKNILAGMTFSVTTGLIIWSLRASSLLLTLMSMMPLWGSMDPLPILDQVNKRKEELKQQRKDKQKEDENAKEVGYLFDQAQSSKNGKPLK